MIRDRRALEADAFADRLLRRAAVGERAERERELDRVEIVALHVLDERELEAVARRDVGDDGGNRGATGGLRGAPAALADDELVAVVDGAHDDRLQHAVMADRVGEPLELGGIEAAARLLGIRADALDRQLAGDGLRLGRRRRLGLGAALARGAGNQRAEAAAERAAFGSRHRSPPAD